MEKTNAGVKWGALTDEGALGAHAATCALTVILADVRCSHLQMEC